MKPIKLKGYTIIPDPSGKRAHEYPVSLLEELCDVEDRGHRYTDASRFIYRTPYLEHRKDIRFGSALAAIQCLLEKYYENPFILILIEPN
jgi:hypothetical protein